MISGVPPEPSSSALAIALDPGRMRDVLARYLRNPSGEPVVIQACAVAGSSRDATRCTVRYAVRLAIGPDKRQYDQVVSAVLYPLARAERVWAQIEATDGESAPAATSPNCLLKPYGLVPDLGILLQTYPHDHRLPGLLPLSEGPPVDVEEVLLARAGADGGRSRRWRTEIIRYAVGKRVTLRWTLPAEQRGSERAAACCAFVKVFRDEMESRRAYDILNALWVRMASNENAPFRVAQPVAHIDGASAMVQMAVDAVPLATLLGNEATAEWALRRAATALAALHNMEFPDVTSSATMDAIARLHRSAVKLSLFHPPYRREIESIVEAARASLVPARAVPIHADFKAAHVLVDEGDVTLLDVDKLTLGDPLVDVANFLAHLARDWPRYELSEQRRRAAIAAFVDAYFSGAMTALRSQLPAHYAVALVNKAANLNRRQDAGWQEHVGLLLREARETVAMMEGTSQAA